MVYLSKVDAAATYHERSSPGSQELDARAELLPEHSDVMAKVKIIDLTDEIPSGPVALSHSLSPEIKTKLASSLLQFAKTEEGRKTLMNLYNASGLAPTTNINYDGVHNVIIKLGKSVQELVPGGVTYYNTNISPLFTN